MDSPITRGPIPPKPQGQQIRERRVPVGNDLRGPQHNSQFKDLADHDEMREFIKNNHPQLLAQVHETDGAQKTIEHMPARALKEPASQPLPLPPQINNVQAPTFQKEPETKGEHWYSDDEEASAIIKRLGLEKLPEDHQRRIIQTHRGVEGQPKKVISNGPEAKDIPITPPPISPNQMRKQLLEELKATGKIPDAEEPKPAPRFVVRYVPKYDHDDYESVGLVSDFVFYPFESLMVRKFNISDAVPLANARRERDLEGFIRTVGKTLLDVDVFDLTRPDFRYLLYWHQINSFMHSPMNISWTSKYNNENLYRISDRTLKYDKPQMTREEYQKDYKSKGLGWSTMRDWLFYQNNYETFTQEEDYLFDKAQWFLGPEGNTSFQSRIDRMSELSAKSLDVFGLIPQFVENGRHNIRESFYATDAKFDANKHLQSLKKQLELLNKQKSETDPGEIYDIELLDEQIEPVQAEIAAIEGAFERKEAVEPDVENIPLNIGILDFFPDI